MEPEALRKLAEAVAAFIAAVDIAAEAKTAAEKKKTAKAVEEAMAAVKAETADVETAAKAAMQAVEAAKAEAGQILSDANAEASRIIEEAAKLAAEKTSESIETPPAAPADMKGGVRIRSKIDGFRRAGISHPKDATEYPAGAFTAKQIEILKGEPNLVVEDL